MAPDSRDARNDGRPSIVGKAVRAVVVGGTLAGVVGAVIALPVAAMIDVTLREIVMPLRDSAAERRASAGEPAEGPRGDEARDAKGA